MIKLFVFSSLIFLLTLYSCQSTSDYKQVSLDEVYTTSGGSEYIKKMIEPWMNFDPQAKCFRENKVVYFDFKKIQKSFDLDYSTIIKWQWSYNQSIHNGFNKDTFFKTLELAKKKKNLFNIPRYPKVSMYQLSFDHYQNPSQSLLRFIKDTLPEKGIPIIHSPCLSTVQLQEWGEKNNLEEIWFIGNEIGTTFDQDLKNQPEWTYPLNEVLSPKQVYFNRY